MTRLRPYLGTLFGTALGMLSLMVWLLTFEPHGGPEYSHLLFPALRPLLQQLYPASDVPVPVFLGSALGHWLVPGIAIDLLRALLRRPRSGVHE